MSIPTHNHIRELKSLRDQLINRQSENAQLESRARSAYQNKHADKLKQRQVKFCKQIAALNVVIAFLESEFLKDAVHTELVLREAKGC